jgi:hypothetical protein
MFNMIFNCVGCKLKSTPYLTQSESSSDAVLSSLKVKDEPVDADKLQLSAGLEDEKAVNEPNIKVKLETLNESAPCTSVKKERLDNEEDNSDSKCAAEKTGDYKTCNEAVGEPLNNETSESKHFVTEMKDCSRACSVVNGSTEGPEKTSCNGEVCVSVTDQPMMSAADNVNELLSRNNGKPSFAQRVSDLHAAESKAVCTDREEQLVSNVNESALSHAEEKVVSGEAQGVSGNLRLHSSSTLFFF